MMPGQTDAVGVLRSKRSLPVAFVIPLVLFAAAPADGAITKRPTCKQAGSRTLAQNNVARVYEVRPSRTARDSQLYGCRRSTGKRVLLDRAADDYTTYALTYYGNVRLAGYHVAWASSSIDISCKAACPPGYDGRSSSVRVFNLRRRKGRSIPGALPLGPALVVSRSGGVAWASQNGGDNAVEIHASLRRGDDRVLDSGNIEPKSLAIEITIISWIRDGAERFARLR